MLIAVVPRFFSQANRLTSTQNRKRVGLLRERFEGRNEIRNRAKRAVERQNASKASEQEVERHGRDRRGCRPAGPWTFDEDSRPGQSRVAGLGDESAATRESLARAAIIERNLELNPQDAGLSGGSFVGVAGMDVSCASLRALNRRRRSLDVWMIRATSARRAWQLARSDGGFAFSLLISFESPTSLRSLYTETKLPAPAGASRSIELTSR
jgi:hypothetical protein